MADHDYATLENLLRQALELVRARVAPAEAQDVLDFLDAAEYGLAFETLAAAVVEANAPVTAAFRALMQNAAHRMKYSDDFSETREPEVAAALTLVWEACRDRAE